jgi:hypothetical protein
VVLIIDTIGGDNMIDVINRCIETKNKIIKFSEIITIEGFNFRIECDEIGEEHFNADITFAAIQKDVSIPLKIKFFDVSSLTIDRHNRQIMGFDILDMNQHGWSSDVQYHFKDYEDGVMDFYCSEISLIE